MNEYLESLKYEAKQNPILALGAITAAAAVAVKLMGALTERKYANAWDKEVKRRRMNTR